MKMNELINRDLRHIWHPCSQMKDYEILRPIIVEKAAGSYLQTQGGKKVIDAISSWWCKSLGHNHPRLKRALIEQLEKFEHVILANTTNQTIVTLSEKLAQLLPELDKVSYASDGSCAVEMAIKMSMHLRKLEGKAEKTKFMALRNAYHGETTGALSLSDLGLYRQPYEDILFTPYFIDNIPYVNSINDPLWADCSSAWLQIEKILNTEIDTSKITALIVEPIVQGAGGMRIYSQDFLRRLRAWTQSKDIHLIADEIMTGLGRTGKMLACQHAQIIPDFLCLGKGLTAGYLPMSVMLTSSKVYNMFYDDYESGKSFMHSHSHSGNTLAASVAIEALTILQEESLCDYAAKMSDILLANMQAIADKTGCLTNIRSIGAIAAADLVSTKKTGRLGFQVFQKAMEFGAFLRPLGNTIYWCVPLNTELTTLEELTHITEQAILFAI